MKGATEVVVSALELIRHFNPRTREGCDLLTKMGGYKNGFISIHAPVKGATYGQLFLLDLIEISIHAPVKGAT